MEKQRQVKMLSIIALVVAVAGMTLGFAAFSTTLNISSSATVTPNSEDFKIVAYGLPEGYDEALIQQGNIAAIEEFTSTTSVHPILGGKWNDTDMPYNASIGKISSTNNSIVISNIHVELKKEYENAIYPIIIKNEGKYDAYVTAEHIGENICTPKDGEMTPLMTEACQQIAYDVDMIDSSSNELYFNEDKFLLPKNDYLIVGINLYNFYHGDNIDMPDGAMDIIFPDVKFTFSTTQ